MKVGSHANGFKISVLQLLLVFMILQGSIAFLTNGLAFTFDEAMWQYIGRNWFRHGLAPYSGGVDNKSPLIFMIFGLSDLLFGVNYIFPRILGIGMEMAGLYFIYKTAGYMAALPPLNLPQERCERAGKLAMIIYGLSMLWRSTGGKLVSDTETYAITLIILSFYLGLIARNQKSHFISGLVAGLGFAFKLTAIFGIAAIFMATLRKSLFATLVFSLGVILSAATVTGLIALSGVHLHALFINAFSDNFGAGSTTDHPLSWRLESFQRGFFYSGLLLLYPAAIAYMLIRKKIDAVTIWLICEFIGMNILGVYATNHFKQLLPALSLMNGLAISYWIEVYRLPERKLMIVTLILLFPKTLEPVYVLKKIFFPIPDRSAELCREPYPEIDDYSKKRLGLWIRSNTTEDQHVLVAGFTPEVQVYSERLSPSIYFNDTETKRAKALFMQEVLAHKPDMVAIPLSAVYMREVGEDMRVFVGNLVDRYYNYDSCKYGYGIYRVRGK